MDSTILAAIIGGLATVGGSILAVVLTRLFDNPMGFQKNVRQASLIGHWEGTVQQQTGISMDGPISLRLRSSGRYIRGEGAVHLSYQNGTVNEPITVFGGFVHDRFLKLEYSLEALPGAVQFGFTLLELSLDGQTLSGLYVGYGSRVTNGLVSGSLHFNRGGTMPLTSNLSQKTI